MHESGSSRIPDLSILARIQSSQSKDDKSGLKGFDPLCSPDQEIIQLETDLINKVLILIYIYR